jgi:hypothetical protein
MGDNDDRANLVREARANYAARHEALRRAALPGKDGSPQAVEATLASISEEVTADAIERRRRGSKPEAH